MCANAGAARGVEIPGEAPRRPQGAVGRGGAELALQNYLALLALLLVYCTSSPLLDEVPACRSLPIQLLIFLCFPHPPAHPLLLQLAPLCAEFSFFTGGANAAPLMARASPRSPLILAIIA